MKIKHLKLNKLKDKEVLEIREDTFFILESQQNFQNKKIILEIRKKNSKINLVFAAVINEQNLDLEIEVKHKSPNTESNVEIRTILKKGANFRLKGNIRMENRAKDSSGKLDIRGLAMNEDVCWEIYPSLEINNTNIRVEHKASLISFSKKQLSYLISRGLSEKEALRTLEEGFLNELIGKIPEDKLKNILKDNIIRKLNL